MKYPKEYLDEIKARLKVSTVVSKTVNLKKRGKEFVGLSPFKNEKTPSFTVNDEKEFYHCFSTGEHGNIFDFIMKTQNLKFGEAVKTLANFAGMQPYTFSKQDEEREKNWKEYSSIYFDYVENYHQALLKNHTSESARNYLNKRNLTEDEIKKFKIGYVEKNGNYYEKLREKHNEKVLKDCGLFYFDEKKNIYVERFRDRVIFPINTISGQPIAIGGRIISNQSYLAKYINSPETFFFKKRNNLYNLDKARKLSSSSDFVYLVEGYMDVVGLTKNKIENVVANLGTALSERQILLLSQFFNEVIICFDGDESGYKAAVRAAENSIKELQPEKQISFLFLPDKEDPDSYVSKKGKNSFLEFSKENKVSIHQFIYNHYKNEHSNTPSSLAILEKKLRFIANSIKDQFIKKYILEFFLEKISLFTPHSNKNNKKFYSNKATTLESTRKYFNDTKSLSPIELKEFSFLYLILNDLEITKENLHIVQNVRLFTNENRLVFESIINKLKESKELSLDELNLDNQLIGKINKFSSIKHILNKIQGNKEQKIQLLEEIIKDLKNYELEFRIEELESKFSRDLSESTFNEIRELKKMQKIN